MYPVRNQLLLALAPDELAQLAPHLRMTRLPRQMVLHETGHEIERVYFPESGAISLVVDLASGEVIEAALIGADGVVGGSDALRSTAALNRAVMQIEGSVLTIEAEALRRICADGSQLRKLIGRHERFVLAQAQQSAACNVAHSLEARLARWLLRARDLCGSNFTLTQEALAAFLGVRRTSVSLTAHALQNAGVIRYRRGEIEILDVDALRGVACECHATLVAHRERLLEQPAPNVALAVAGGKR